MPIINTGIYRTLYKVLPHRKLKFVLLVCQRLRYVRPKRRLGRCTPCGTVTMSQEVLQQLVQTAVSAAIEQNSAVTERDVIDATTAAEQADASAAERIEAAATIGLSSP